MFKAYATYSDALQLVVLVRAEVNQRNLYLVELPLCHFLVTLQNTTAALLVKGIYFCSKIAAASFIPLVKLCVVGAKI